MSEIIKKAVESLNNLSTAIVDGWSIDKTLNENWGWNFPALNKYELASIPNQLAISIEKIDIKSFENDEELIQDLEDIPNRINTFITRTLPHLYNGNGNQAVPVLFSLMEWIESVLKPINSWESLYDNKAMPVKLKRRLNSISAQIDEIVPEKEKITSQIKLIQDATETAESLPMDLQNLKKAQKTIKDLSTQSAELYGKIDTYFRNAESNLDSISKKRVEADKLVDKCEEAYRITTTKGLAASFDSRAKKSSQSMYLWVLGLLFALSVATWIGSERFDTIYKAINIDSPQWGTIWMNLILALFSLTAPVWFAWVATKQIGQRFRLAEDYGYKASVAKAYEGYRKEAARLDPAFESRLFSSALSRLEEAPLRLMETDTHGSPWHELVNSPQFEKALDKVPELKNKFISLAKRNNIVKNGKENYSDENHTSEVE